MMHEHGKSDRRVVPTKPPNNGVGWPLQGPARVWLNNSAGSRCVAIVVAQKPAQALATPHLAVVTPNPWLWGNELIVETLMIALGMVM